MTSHQREAHIENNNTCSEMSNMNKLLFPGLFDKDIPKNDTWFNGSEFGHKTKPVIGLWRYLVY